MGSCITVEGRFAKLPYERLSQMSPIRLFQIETSGFGS